ncbi:SDR family oxidoreductase [Nonomuraea rubra]|uniref:dTDP-4-dehydrorhamnose reductase n=1 Tax=Nonomuraea rubra TaxID=46180 RepID=A0A7X0TYZ9_9ACTN|nr:sugar nucleotide-binding protein [Nonomuraea rubra]MBB6549152.1 dTDP-4-dehydrorhamnose reductase [Nonomuraea rubra]
MRVLIVGGSGFLGSELVRRCAAAGHDVGATYLTRPGDPAQATWLRMDVRERRDVAAVIDAFRPEVTINAAYRQAGWATTADGAAHVAAGVAGVGGRLVQVSSDVVFSGAADRYDETCPPDPITPYGAAKAAAETAVRAMLPDAAIARTSLILGHGRSGHETLVRSLASGAGEGVLFTDDVRCPVHVCDLAAALMEAAVLGLSGVLHVAGADAVSRYELGVLIARRDGLDPARLRTGLRAGSGVPGPLELRLDCSATQHRLATRLRGAREFLATPTA